MIHLLRVCRREVARAPHPASPTPPPGRAARFKRSRREKVANAVT